MKKITKFFLFMTLLVGMLILGTQAVSAEDRVYYDSTNKTVTYTSLDFSIEEKGKLFVAAYSDDKLLDISTKNVGIYNETVSANLSVNVKPTVVKAFVFDGTLKPLSSSAVIQSTDFIDIEEKVTLTLSETDFSYDHSAGVFLYTKGSDAIQKQLTINKENLVVYYNGEKLTESKIETLGGLYKLLEEYASVVTFDDFNYGLCGKIDIINYNYYKVESVYAEDSVIILAAGCLDLSKEYRGTKFIYNLYDEGGNEISLSDIQKGDILNVVAPLGDDGYIDYTLDTVGYMDIYITRRSVKGVVEEALLSFIYKINGEYYKSLCGLSLGEDATFYLTIDNYIYDRESNISNYSIAFIKDYENTTDSGVITHKLRLFREYNSFNNYNVASSVRVYDESGVNIYNRENGGQDTFFEENIAPIVANQSTREEAEVMLEKRVIAYDLDKNGEICAICLPGALYQSPFMATNITYGGYNKDTNIFAGRDIDDKAVLFITPVSYFYDTGTYNVTEDEMWTDSFASLDEDDYYDMSIFTFDDQTIRAGIIKEDIMRKLSDWLSVATSVSEVLNSDGYIVKKYTFIEGGEKLSLTVSADAWVPELSYGDVFRYCINRNNEITMVHLVYDASTSAFNDNGFGYSNWATNDMALVYGKITEIENSKMTVEGVDFGMDLTLRLNDTEGNTYANIDETILSTYPDRAVTILKNALSLNTSYEGSTNDYYVVALVGESGRFEDCVQIKREAENVGNTPDIEEGDDPDSETDGDILDYNIAFIKAYDSETSDSGVTTHKLRLLKDDDSFKNYNVASSLCVYDESGSSIYKQEDNSQNAFFNEKIAPIVANQATREDAEALLEKRVIAYDVNENGEICAICIPGTGYESPLMKLAVNYGSYNEDTNMFARKDVGENAVLFITPISYLYDTDSYNVTEDEMWADSFTSLNDDDSYNMTIYTFDNEYIRAGITNREIVSRLSNGFAVVKSTGVALNADGNVVDTFTIIQGREILSLNVSYDAYNINYTPGDVFRYVTNRDGEISKAQLIYDVSENKFNDNGFGYNWLSINDMAFVYGKITEIENSKMTVEGVDFGMDLKLRLNDAEGNTYANIDLTSSANPNNFVSVLSSSLALKETYIGSKYDYYVVALVGESGRFEDCIQITKDAVTPDPAANLAVVKSAGDISDEEENVVNPYTPLQSGEVSVIVKDNDSTDQITEISKGDILAIQ